MKNINPIIESPCHSLEHPLKVPQYVRDARQKIYQEVAIQTDRQIDKPEIKAMPIKKANKISPRRRGAPCKPFKGIINGIHSNGHLKVDDTPGWHQGSGKNTLAIEQIMKFAEVSLKI